MRCKPGDLAVIVNCVLFPENNGRLVEVVECTNRDSWMAPDGIFWQDPEIGAAYGVKSLGSTFSSNSGETEYAWFYGHCVRPLRDNPGQDETLTWKDVPSTTKETA